MSRQPGGEVTSADGQIACGTVGTRCGPATYGWADTATLTATPDAGNMFGTWAGDCQGRKFPAANGAYLCYLDTTTYGADKFVAAVFDVAGRAQHVNFTDPALHGLEFLNWKAGKPDTFECTYCHGATYAGVGLAPSCNDCHARNGHPNWLNDCTFCHGAPPPPPPPTFPTMGHPGVSNDITMCFGCHQDTVDRDGNIIPNGKHMNGAIEATGGHAAGYNDPKIHGRDFFGAISSNPATPYCTGCHGTNYEILIANGRSCNTCHAAAPSLTPPGGGWSGSSPWSSNCTFCHGARDINYAGDVTQAAPPDAISQRLTGTAAPDRTGAHAAHLAQGPFALAFQCGVCHQVPSAMTHISGKDVRATVLLFPPGATSPDPTGYDTTIGNPTSGTCATYCHDPLAIGNRSPAWATTGMQCNSCHGVPPSTAIHAGMSGADLTGCVDCHPDTITTGGALNVTGGKHLNGTVDVVTGHAAGFADPSVHGPQFLNTVAGASGALDCQGCHGTSLAYCTSCHSQAANGGWVSWQTNCTFCHGTKTPVYTSADLKLAAPPDAISQRLNGVEVPDKTGQHTLHLNDGGFVPAPAFQCSTCHPVPTDVNHVSVDRLATVTLVASQAFPALGPADLARLPSPLGTYDRSTGICAVYCHNVPNGGGNNTQMKWTNDFDFATPILDCTDCHALPPPTGATVIGHTYATPPTNTRYCGASGCANHAYHRTALQSNGYDSCANCHFGSAQGQPYNGLHVNGKPDIVYTPDSAGLPKKFTATWDPVTRTCTASCHVNSGPTTPQRW
ncbi:CxxxxCH/CxxCH domain c-type cytochrome [Anaeromyxobacter oryzae]|uniref:Cytochrome c domain-containing protein n=1 Tax=Anaeromyxobacter oryzae TaxID=2918170 RepID=A0ABM7X0A8_9BACT|nr:hypothetical protein [Anaeromyxobacter oryzae]BDG05234.1 hypothetical protein AMOR_42300 [Anaeromyxobacter oryzae]